MPEPAAPLVLPGGLRADTTLRIICALLAVVSAALFLTADAPQLLFRSMLAIAKSPAVAASAVSYAFAGAALTFAAIAIAWPRLAALCRSILASLLRLPHAEYVVIVAVAALMLRLLVATIPSNTAASDVAWYHGVASSLAQGHGVALEGTRTAYRPPGYPWLLSLPYLIFGPHPAWAWLWGTIATAVLLVATHIAAMRLYGVAVARLATMGLAIYPALALMCAVPASDLPFTAGATALVAFALSLPPYAWGKTVALGFVIALITLIRTVGIAFVGVVMFCWWSSALERRRLLLHGIVLIAVVAAPLALWSARNYELFGTPTLATNSGRNLWIGSHARATGAFVPPGTSGFLRNRDLNEAEVDRVFFDEGVRFVREQPLAWLQLIPRKLAHLFALELSAAQWLLHDQPVSPWVKYALYAISQLAYSILLALFLIRMLSILSAGERPAGVQWAGFVVGAAVVAVTIVTFGQDRFRLPFLPWMVIEAAVASTRMAGLATEPTIDS